MSVRVSDIHGVTQPLESSELILKYKKTTKENSVKTKIDA